MLQVLALTGPEGRRCALIQYGASYAAYNRGKKSIAVNAGDAKGREVVKKLVAGADVFLQVKFHRVGPNCGT